jgi:hypothetical protein
VLLALQEEFQRQSPASRFMRASLPLVVGAPSLKKDLRKASANFIQCELVLAEVPEADPSLQSRSCR